MRLFSVCILCLLFPGCHSQTGKELTAQQSRNTILGADSALVRFFGALDSLSVQPGRTLSVVHIGDSHIQADYFSGMLRVLLQEKFGNAGRGLIFPYALARTNEPVNYRSVSADEWKAVRSVINPDSAAIGVSGISLFSKSSHAGFSLSIRSQKGMSYAFNRVTLFSRRADPENTRLSADHAMSSVAQKQTAFTCVFDLPDTCKSLSIRFSAGQGIDVHGLVLSNGRGGILYHTIGVNGATFESYNSASLFMQQLPELKPDLVIVSLGTNESYAGRFEMAEFERQVKAFTEAIRLRCSSCSVLFTTPADNCKLKKGKAFTNDRSRLIGSFLKAYADRNNYAVWDLYEVMGGRGSMKQWKMQGKATSDYVHFTRKGYELQGTLLFEALLNSYTQRR